MLNLPTLHIYLTQLISNSDNIHTALLLTLEGAVVSFASRPLSSRHSTSSTFPSTNYSISYHRSKDDIWILAGLSAEVWAETTDTIGMEVGMVESELGRILVVPVDDTSPEVQDEREPLLLLALHGSAEADWNTMSIKAKKLAAYLAPSVNKYRSTIEPSPPTRAVSKSRTRSTATSPGGFLR